MSELTALSAEIGKMHGNTINIPTSFLILFPPPPTHCPGISIHL
ncbi:MULTISPECIES: hypothetical protein [Caldilinea]|jgi:hypothetical protein|nr:MULTISPECIES: hypothetical protein [Caldilinea]GIV75262.1 MAG: hypothetical protein KatS3mg049_3818 [Caldilinea sp.]